MTSPRQTRSFISPSGRNWSVEERAGTLRFTSGELVLEYAPWPPSLSDASDDMLVALARLAQPPRLGMAGVPSPTTTGAREPGLSQLHWLVAALLGEERSPLPLLSPSTSRSESATEMRGVTPARPGATSGVRSTDVKLDLASRLAAAIALPPEQRTVVLRTTITAEDRAVLIALAAAIEGEEQARASELEDHTLRDRARRFREAAQFLSLVAADEGAGQA